LSVLNIPTAEVFEPLLYPARYKGAWGGRGSGKSHFFAETLIDDALRFPGEAGEGMRALCVREIQKALKQSAKQLIDKKLHDLGLGEKDGFKSFEGVIKTPGDGLIDFTGMQDHTADSVKSYESFHRAWVEEAHTLSATSLSLLRPTIRWEDKAKGLESEIWCSWNPRRKTDPVDVMFRGDETPTNLTVVKANWRDNPWFPDVLEQERLDCLRITPEQYDHIWEGGYATVLEGAYYAQAIQEARQDKRIGIVGPDPLMTYRLFCDIGGTGAKADAFTIWVAQFIGREIRVLDYYESVGQPLAAHLTWMRKQGYEPDKAQIWLPHDGSANDKVFDISYESALKQAGYTVTTIPNQGKGAAMARVESARRTFPLVWFNEKATESGIAALGWYHEKKDENRGIGLGPEHDWASHGADAYGLMSIVFEQQGKQVKITDPYEHWQDYG
jgi:phage terminase large subunit